MSLFSTLLRSNPIRLDMFGSQESQSQSTDGTQKDFYHRFCVPFMKIAMPFSAMKYIILLLYCIRSMQEHLAMPTYCRDPRNTFSCSSSSCYWLHKVMLNLPHFLVSGGLFVEQCAYILVALFMSSLLFLYAVHLAHQETEIRRPFRAILIFPSLFFELAICFLSYYAVVISGIVYNRTATENPEYHSSVFIIFAIIVSVFYALLLLIHFAAVFYIMTVNPMAIYAISNANYSIMKYGRNVAGRSVNYETLPSIPNETYGASVSSYSQIRSWNNTIRSTNTARARGVVQTVENDYLELI